MKEKVPGDNRRGSSGLTQRSTWSGIVVALAVVLTALNLFPPADPYYHVRSEVVISASRLPQLQSLLREKQPSTVESDTQQAVQLIDLQVLDQASKMIEGPIDVDQQIALVAIEALWHERCSLPALKDWLRNITRFDQHELSSTDVARRNRFAAWALNAAEHYAERHNFLSDRPPLRTTRDGKSFELAHEQTASEDISSQSRTTFSLASYDSLVSGTETDSARLDADQEHLRLAERIRERQAELTDAEHAWREHVDQAHGLLRIATQPQVSVRASFVPTWTVFSVLLLGVFSASIAGWFHHRMQSGGAHEPNQVAEGLSLQGLPLAGRMALPLPNYQVDDWVDRSSRNLTKFGRQAARNSTLICESLIAVWCVLLVTRFVTDSFWREILVESPLPALSRLLTGMP